MRFLRLDLRGFGPFTGAVLPLDAGDCGLHVIYGPNEAGKSTALRAIEQFLFGIDARTTDDFVHPKNKLCIAACLKGSDGAHLELVRRKGTKNTLLEGDEKTVADPARLARLLGNLSPELFRTMFGLNRAMLEQGGKEILQGGGQIGQLLFAAGSGIADLRRVRDRLQGRYEALFLPRGQKQSINAHLSEWSTKRTELKAQMLPADIFLLHERALGEAKEQRNRLQCDADQLDVQISRLTRLRDAQPMLVRRDALLRELHEYRDAVLLPDDIPGRRFDTLSALGRAQAICTSADESLHRIDNEVALLPFSKEILVHAEDIEALFQEKGSIDKAQVDRGPNLRSLQSHEHRAHELWKSLGRTGDLGKEIESLRLPPNEAERIRRHGQRLERIQADRDNAAASIERQTQKIAECDEALAALPPVCDIAELRRQTARVQKLGPLEENLATVEQQIILWKNQAEQTRQRLQIREGPIEDIVKWPVPNHETVEKYDQDFRDIKQRLNAFVREREDAEADLARQTGEIRQLELTHDVPAEEELKQARQRRDDWWRRLRDAMKGVKAAPPEAMINAYEASVVEADLLVDRLRHEAERVAKKAELIAQTDRRHADLLRMDAREKEVRQRFENLDKAWQVLWEPLGLAALSPAEMRVTVTRFEELVQFIHNLQLQEELAKKQSSRIAELSAQMRKALTDASSPPPPPLSLAELLETGLAVLQEQAGRRNDAERLQSERAGAEKDVRQAESAKKKSEGEIVVWNETWIRFMERLGQPPTMAPADASERLEAIQQLWTEWDHAGVLRARIDGIDRDKEDFDRRVIDLRDRLLPGSDHESPRAVMELNQKLKEARARQKQVETLRKEGEDWRAKAEAAQADLRAQEAILAALCQQAGATSVVELPAIEQRSTHRRNLERELRDRNAELAPLQGGRSLEDFCAEVAGLDIDGLESDLRRLGQEKLRLQESMREKDTTIGSELNELRRMDGSAAAADAAQRVEELTAQVCEEVRAYAALRIAAGVLSLGVERYRKKNEGPILQRAGELFAHLTAGSFSGLAVEPTDEDEPVLVGVRDADRTALRVEAMSDGSRDQLYLALRLASLELYSQSHEPIPFIVDDLLLAFDDVRAVAALGALAELSRRTQVIFFTHHRHLVELAKQNLSRDVLFVHTLEKSGRAISQT